MHVLLIFLILCQDRTRIYVKYMRQSTYQQTATFKFNFCGLNLDVAPSWHNLFIANEAASGRTTMMVYIYERVLVKGKGKGYLSRTESSNHK